MVSCSRRLARSGALALLALGGLSGCDAYGVRVQPLATSVQRPSNVAVYLEVSDSGTPLDHLPLSKFRVIEDGKPLDATQIGLTLLPENVATAHRALLLVDLTAAKSAADRQTLSQAAAGFVRRVEKTEPVSVFAFDSAAHLYPVGDFAQDANADSPQTLDKLQALHASGKSRNLYGAMQQALTRLDSLLAQSPQPVRVGTLVVVTAGPDLAKHTSWSRLQSVLKHTRNAVIAVGDLHQRGLSLDDLGPDGSVPMKSLATAKHAFAKAAERVAALDESRYLLAYCSPARGGVHQARVEVRIKDKRGVKKSGEASFRFSADGFGPGCTSSTRPRFVVTLLEARGGSVASPPPLEETASSDKKSPEPHGKHHHAKKRRHAERHGHAERQRREPPARPRRPHPAKPAAQPDFEP